MKAAAAEPKGPVGKLILLPRSNVDRSSPWTRARRGLRQAADLGGHAIQRRPGRRLGQQVVEMPDGPITLDVLLRDHRLPACNERYVVKITGGRSQVLDQLARHSTSSIAIELCVSPSTWLLDKDQLAGLAARFDRPDPAPASRDEVLITGAWMSSLGALDLSKERELQGPNLRKEIAEGWATYGQVPNLDELVEKARKEPARFVIEPSRGSQSRRPGLEITATELRGLNQRREESKKEGTPLRKIKPGDTVSLCANRSSATGPAALRVPAVVRRTPNRGDGTSASDGTVKVDQVIRVALGVAVWETVSIAEGAVERRRMRSAMQHVAPVVRVVARVQQAELTLTEQNACLLSPLAMDSMGLASGNYVVVRAARSGGGIGSLLIKAYVAPDDVVTRRRSYYGGGMVAPLPSEEGALGMTQALPWIWLDQYARDALGITEGLQAVVVQPSRRHVLLENSRELGIIAAVTLAGAVAVAPQTESYFWLLLVVGGIVPFLLVLARVRSRLK